jgi:pyruvate dehydrogenase E1 component beta subunit
MTTKRIITSAQAIREALQLALQKDPAVYVVGLGAPDPKGIFGTTIGLQDEFGPDRVMDMPTSENGMTGVVLGSALLGMRPVLTHQRIDFALLSMDQIVSQAANWHYMFGGQNSVPVVIRMVIGRGWGQGSQHAQSLQAWFAHIPGLKVIMPSNPHDCKGLLLAAIRDNNPVIFIEHRWLHFVTGEVPEGWYEVPLGSARVVREGQDITLCGTSYMTLECIRAAELLAEDGISAEVVDIRSLRPLDRETILASVRKTGRLIAADTGWTSYGVTAEIMATVTEAAFDSLKAAPARAASPDVPSPSTPALAEHFYPRANDIVRKARIALGRGPDEGKALPELTTAVDQPDPSYVGPF